MRSKVFISNTPFIGGVQFGNIWYEADNSFVRGDKIVFQNGYIIDSDCDTLGGVLNRFEKGGFPELNKMKGEYCVVIYDKTADIIYASNDLLGDGMMMYYLKGDLLLLATDFWRVVDYLKPTYEMLDLEAICRYSIYGEPHHTSTILSNLKGFDYGSNNTIHLNNLATESVVYNNYEDVEPKDISLDEAARLFNEAIIESRDYVMKKYHGERLAIGISGGLDSRFMPALYGKDQEYFVIVGDTHVNGNIKPYNINYIDKIGKAYGVPIKKINFANTPVERKIFLDVKNRPLSTETFLKAINKEELNSDLLIFSSGKDLLSTARGMYASGWSLFDIAEKYEGTRYISSYATRDSKYKVILSHIFSGKNSLRSSNSVYYEDFFPIKVFDHDDFYNRSHRFFSQFTHLEDNPEKAILYYRYSNGMELNNGAFESITGQMKAAYNYYYPFAYDALKILPMEYVNNRIILKYLIDKYYPEVSKIEGEHSIYGIHDENKVSSIRIVKSLISKKIRGVSIMMMTPEMKTEYLRAFDNSISSWYDKIFDVEKVRTVVDRDSHLFLNHLKIRVVLSAIENRTWKQYLD